MIKNKKLNPLINIMRVFGLSSKKPRNLLIIGAIFLVILTAFMILRWFAKLIKLEKKVTDKHSFMKKSQEIVKCSPGIVRTYALEELKMATKDFRIKIGVGGTSSVYLAQLGDGKFGAVKRVMEDRDGSKKIFLDEVSILLRISHPNVVGLMGFCLEKGEQLLLLKYVPNKSLFDRMHTKNGQSSGILTWSNRLNIALDIARALHYLHSQSDPPIIHRDIKSSNILLIDNNHAKLADFWLCKLGCDKSTGSQSPTPTSIKGSFGYVDTNYLKTGFVSPKSDVYSYGVLLVELITGLKSIQGSIPLAEWTQDFRKNDDIQILAKLLDPKLKGDVNLEQLKVLIDEANLALLENSEARPDMNYIVNAILTFMKYQSLHHQMPV